MCRKRIEAEKRAVKLIMKEMFNKTLLSFHFELCQPGDFAIRFVWCDHWFEFRRAKDLYSTRFG